MTDNTERTFTPHPTATKCCWWCGYTIAGHNEDSTCKPGTVVRTGTVTGRLNVNQVPPLQRVKPHHEWELTIPSTEVAFNIQQRWHLKALATWERVACSHMSTCALYLRRSHVQPTTLYQCTMRELALQESSHATRAWRKYRQHKVQLDALRALEASRG